MSYTRESLLNYLKTDNPRLFVSECPEETKSRSNSKSGKTTWAKPQVIKDWEDFEYEALSSIYGGALLEVLERQFNLEGFRTPEKPFRQIQSEDSLTSLVVKWNQSIVSGALSTAQAELDQHLPQGKIYMYKGSQAKYPGENPSFRPDWAGVKPVPTEWDATRAMAKNILPGESKPNRKWSSQQVERGVPEKVRKAPQWYLPLQQVYSYCIAANARYGYLITDKELVVLRVRPNISVESSKSKPLNNGMESIKDIEPNRKPGTVKTKREDPSSAAFRTKRNGILEIKAIQWQDDAKGQRKAPPSLTINLALWWLHIMAADKHDIEDTYPPLRTAGWTGGAHTQASSFDQLSNANIESPRVRNKRLWADDSGDEDDTPQKRQTRSRAKAARSAT